MVLAEGESKSRSQKGAEIAKTSNEEIAVKDDPMLEMPPKAEVAASAPDVPTSSTSKELNDMLLASLQQQSSGFAKSVFKSIEGDIMGLVNTTVSDTIGTFGKKVEAVKKEMSGLNSRVGNVEKKPHP